MRKPRTIIITLFMLAVSASLALWIGLPKQEPESDPIVVSKHESAQSPIPEPESEQVHWPEVVFHEQVYEVGKLFYPIQDEARLEYDDGAMILEIPRLNFKDPVYNGVDDLTLRKGVGLFDESQLPGPENRNVSIAGHRDIYGCEFYYIDTIQEGDLIYLNYDGKRYTYAFEESFVTHDSDWEPIRVKEFSAITLQSCTPIGVASHRIFVVGKLTAIEDLFTGSIAKTPPIDG